MPQEACLFDGTLRENLDPFHEHADDACMAALRRLYLLEEGGPLPLAAREDVEAAQVDDNAGSCRSEITLDSRVAAGGANWSAGQRQLIAMARA